MIIVGPTCTRCSTGPAVWYGGQMEPQVGSFSSYLYFLFCPVLLYRDRYPRKPPNYRKAFTYFLQVYRPRSCVLKVYFLPLCSSLLLSFGSFMFFYWRLECLLQCSKIIVHTVALLLAVKKMPHIHNSIHFSNSLMCIYFFAAVRKSYEWLCRIFFSGFWS